MRKPAPVLVIGLEMGDERLILDWCASGHLPVLKKLLDGGAWAGLESTADELSGSAWPSIYTGVSPGQHGVYHRFQPLPGSQGYVPFFGNLYGAPTFWHILSQAGLRCTVFDAPYTYPEPGYRGAQIFDWATWERFVGKRSTPRSLVHRMRLTNGPYPLPPDALEAELEGHDSETIKEQLVRAARAKARAATWLLQKAQYDLFMVVFSEANPAGRYLWQSDEDGSRSPRLRDLLEVYVEIDHGIGSLLRECGNDVTVFVVSGDGVDPNIQGWHLLPEVLRRLDYLSLRDGVSHRMSVAMPEAGPLRIVRDLMPDDFRRSVGRRLPSRVRDYVALRVGTARIEWPATEAFCLPTEREGYIRINLEGREPLGTVKPGAEYRDLCKDITSVLREMINPATGRPAVRDVLQSHDAFPGLRCEHLPDLIVQWSGEAPISSLTSPRFGKISGASPDPRPGTRGPPGFVLVRGDGVEPGRAFRGHIYDLAPTILTLFGQAPPTYMGGSSWVTVSEIGRTWM